MRTAKEIHYRLIEDGIEAQEDVLYNEPFTITKVGLTEIYAWTEDGNGWQSLEEDSAQVKFDNVSPVVTNARITSGTKGAGTWITSNRRNNSRSK